MGSSISLLDHRRVLILAVQVPHPRYNEKVDVYSVGLVYWEVLQWHQPVKRYPFEGQNEHAIYVDVGQKKLRPSTASMGRQW